MVRLGQGVDRTGRLADEALARAFAAIDEYAALIARARRAADRIRFCATSATRDAANADVFVAGVRDAARRRARGGRPATRRPRSPSTARSATCGAARPTPVLVVDIGGGSTELILGRSRARRRATRWTSARCGCTSGTCTPTRRPPAEVAACVADIDAHLDACPVRPGRGRDRRRRRRHRHHGRRRGARPAGLRPRRVDQAVLPVERRARDRRPAGRDDRRRAARAAVDAPRPGRRDRRRRADPRPGAAPHRRPRRWSSPRPTSSTGSPGRSPGAAAEPFRRPTGWEPGLGRPSRRHP